MGKRRDTSEKLRTEGGDIIEIATKNIAEDTSKDTIEGVFININEDDSSALLSIDEAKELALMLDEVIARSERMVRE